MIPVIHITSTQPRRGENIQSSFFIFKESPTTQYYHVIGQHLFGKSRDVFSLYLLKSGVKSYANSFFENNSRISFLTIKAEYLATCPVWSYGEIRRRVSAAQLHLLDMYNDEEDFDFYQSRNSLRNYLRIIENADFESLETEEYDNSYCEACGCEYWRGEDY